MCPVTFNSLGPPRTVACHSPPSMASPRQEYWNGLPFPSQGDVLDPGMEPMSLCVLRCQADSLSLHHLGSPLTTVPVTKVSLRQNDIPQIRASNCFDFNSYCLPLGRLPKAVNRARKNCFCNSCDLCHC